MRLISKAFISSSLNDITTPYRLLLSTRKFRFTCHRVDNITNGLLLSIVTPEPRVLREICVKGILEIFTTHESDVRRSGLNAGS